MNQGYADNTAGYNSHFVLDNIRHRRGGYGIWDLLIGRFDNAGAWDLNLEFYPGGMRNTEHVITRAVNLTDDSGTTFYNRQTIERQVNLSGLTANVLSMKVYNNTKHQSYGVHEMGAMVRPAGNYR